MEIDYEYAYLNKIVPISSSNEELFILAQNHINDDVLNDLLSKTGKKINIIDSKKYNFNKCFEEYYNISNTDFEIKKEFENIINSDAEKFFDYIISKAHTFIASDIHIINEEKHTLIKFRINSILRTFAIIQNVKAESLIRIIKLKSNIEISKTLSPLEGRFDYNFNNQDMDYRVSIMPTISGEKLTIRILGNTRNIYTFSDLGLNFEEIDIIERNIKKNSGFIIVTGPTGSGKSTTLFTIMHYLNDGTKNIISIEDPVEYKIDGVTQISVNKEKHIDFHNVLRFVLRQDPQIINVGEIRDDITARLAINCANTGHLVLSTMHTNSSISSIRRFQDLSLEPFEVAQSLRVIISQRLIRILCPHCKQVCKIDEKVLKYYNLSGDNEYYKPFGCKNCYGTGYIRQEAIFEILETDDKIKDLIINKNLSADKLNIVFLKDKLLDKIVKGETSIEEVSKYI